MDLLFAQLLAKLHFFSSGLGILTIGSLAALLFLLWDWRFALAGLLVIQTGVAVLVVQLHGLSTDWATVQILIIALCGLMLGLSAYQAPGRQALHPPGAWLLRALVLVLLVVSWRIFDLKLAIPLLAPMIGRLFVWLALCSIVTLCLSDAPFFTCVALLLWCILTQSIVEILLPGHSLFVLIGILEIVLTLACSYLVLIELTPVAQKQVAPTDLTFPESTALLPTLAPHERSRLPAERPSGITRRPALPADGTPDAPLVARGSQ